MKICKNLKSTHFVSPLSSSDWVKTGRKGGNFLKWAELLVPKSSAKIYYLSYGDLNAHFSEYVLQSWASGVHRKLHPSFFASPNCPEAKAYHICQEHNEHGWGCDDKISNNPKNKHHFMSPLSTAVIRGYMSCLTLVIQLKSSRGNQTRET